MEVMITSGLLTDIQKEKKKSMKELSAVNVGGPSVDGSIQGQFNMQMISSSETPRGTIIETTLFVPMKIVLKSAEIEASINYFLIMSVIGLQLMDEENRLLS